MTYIPMSERAPEVGQEVIVFSAGLPKFLGKYEDFPYPRVIDRKVGRFRLLSKDCLWLAVPEPGEPS